MRSLDDPGPAPSPALGSPPLANRRPHPGSVRVWWAAMRPHTLGASLIPVAVGAAAASESVSLDGLTLLACVVAAVCLQLSTNLANDAFDFLRRVDTAERLGPVRVTQAGWLSPRQVFTGVMVANLLAVLAGIQLVHAGGIPILLIGLLSIAAALAYSGGPFPLASHGLGEVAAFIFFGVVAVCGSAYLHTQRFDWLAFLVSVPIGALVSNIMVVNNLRDIKSDTASGKRTLAVRIGERHTRQLYRACLLGSYVFAIGLSLALADLALLLPLLSLPLAVALDREFQRADDGPSFNLCLAHTARLHAAYGALLCLAITL